MDFLLDIVIPKNEINRIDLEEQLIEWGEMRYSHNPARYIGMNEIVFEELTSLSFYSQLLGTRLDTEKYCALNYRGDDLSELEYLINNKAEDIKNNTLYVFLENLMELTSFYIFLLREDEVVKERHVIERKEELKKSLCDSLDWDKPRDIVIEKH